MSIGTFTGKLAVETPDGDNATFSAPTAVTGLTVYVARNGLIQWRGFMFISATRVTFDVTPALGESIEFFYRHP